MALVSIQTSRQILEREDRERKEREALRPPAERQVLDRLQGYVRTCWDAAWSGKQEIERSMLESLRQRNGEYAPSQRAQIEQFGGSDIYMRLTETKCRAAESWLRDILLDTTEPPWGLKPTPEPELPPDVVALAESVAGARVLQFVQGMGISPGPEGIARIRDIALEEARDEREAEARDRAERMRLRISDQFAEGGWENAFNAFLTDLCTFPCAFLKGPVVRRSRTLRWEMGQDGTAVPVPGEVTRPEYERVSPFDIYPEPGVSDLDEGYIIQLHRLTRRELSDMVGLPGYDEAAVKAVLAMGPTASWLPQIHQSERKHLERKDSYYHRPDMLFDMVEFWGSVSGRMLIEWGFQGEVESHVEYDVTVLMVGPMVVKASLNADPLGQKPYVKTSFIKIPGAFWGRSLPETIRDAASVCNAAARSLVNNMAIASGPQVEVNIDRVPVQERLTQIHPWKVWQVNQDPFGTPAPAVRFEQPNDNSSALMNVYTSFSRLADDHSGIPAYIYGDLNVQGAGRTASGLSMLMGAAGKGIRQVVLHIDHDVIKPIVQRQFTWNMRFDPDPSIKGDLEVVARGAVNIAASESMNVRRVEFLAQTLNPVDIEIMGAEGRATLLRKVVKGLEMPADEVIPSRDKLRIQGDLTALAMGSGQQAGVPPQGPVQAVEGQQAGGRDSTTVPRGGVT